MKKKYWLYLEPFVHCVLKGEYLILYNPLNGEIIEFKNSPKIFKLVEELLLKDNLLVVKLTNEHLLDPVILNFIMKVKEGFMGDYLDMEWNKYKPVQVSPEIKVLRNHNSDISSSELLGMEIMSSLSEISIYINSFQNRASGFFENSYKQFLSVSNTSENNELSVYMIENMLYEAASSSLYRINILGRNIFQHSEFKKLTTILNEIPLIKTFFFQYSDVVDYRHSFNLINDSPDFAPNDIKWELNMFIHFPLIENKFKKSLEIVNASAMNTKYHFIVEKEEDISEAEKIILEFNLVENSFLPYYNGNNLDFFKNAVFITKEDIVDSRPQQKDILARQVINQINFGKLIVLANGFIHANVNEPALGQLGQDSIYNAVYKALQQESSWRRTRKEIQPCYECVFQYLCPSLSNYEYVLEQNNLCHIWNNE